MTTATQRFYTRSRTMDNTFGDFECRSCGAYVSAGIGLSGVRNRNHCPYCLASRHLDQFEAGDRLSACKERMVPIGLTLKRVAKKYASHRQGELMVVHQCEGCGKVSVNRIAADDVAEVMLAVLARSARLDADTRLKLAQDGINLLEAGAIDVVQQHLFGITCCDPQCN